MANEAVEKLQPLQKLNYIRVPTRNLEVICMSSRPDFEKRAYF